MPFEYDEGWRPGHLARDIPAGYAASIASGQNRIKDPCIHAYYDKLRRIVSGPLFTAERLQAIVALNLPGGATIRPCR
jgi:arabinofuranosyltransferase